MDGVSGNTTHVFSDCLHSFLVSVPAIYGFLQDEYVHPIIYGSFRKVATYCILLMV